MKRVNLVPYKLGSESCRLLRDALLARGLRCHRIAYNSNTYKPKVGTLHVLWGNVPNTVWSGKQVNAGAGAATNKLAAFERMKNANISVPDYTTNPTDAAAWVDAGETVVGRCNLNGHSGDGIVLFGGEFSHVITHAPLYVKYKKKKAEYRVHVFNGTVIDVQQKRRKSGVENVSSYIRNIDQGWVFCRENVNPASMVLEESKKAVQAIGLLFGAVDVIWNEYEQKAYVLEVNTAPGLEGTTVEKYADAIKEYVNAN